MTASTHPLAHDLSLRKIVDYALKHRASDIHLKVGSPLATRVDSVLRFVPAAAITEDDSLGGPTFMHLVENQSWDQKCFLGVLLW